MKWLSLKDFANLAEISEDEINNLVKSGKIATKEEEGTTLIDAKNAIKALANSHKFVSIDFVEKTIGTILNLHKQVVDGKEDAIEALKSENEFLKEALYSLQELYEEDRKTIELLQKKLEDTQKELEIVKRKYKLMWNKTIEKFS